MQHDLSKSSDMSTTNSTPPTLKRTLFAPDSKLRLIWRVVIFFAAGIILVSILGLALEFVAKSLNLAPGLTASNIALGELGNFAVAVICTGIFAIYERRRIDSYGLPISRAFSRQTFEGAAAGVIMAGAVAGGMIALGGMQIRALSLHGSEPVISALAWLGATICVGIAEELWFHSYLQVTLWKSIGFWPASIVLALIFAAAHYFFKPGENIWDVITLVSLSLLVSYSLLRTGTLWFAVGFHIAFDYMQFFVIGTPNGGQVPVGRLLDVTFIGPAWINGGVLGTEASFLMYPAIVLLWIYVWWRYRHHSPFEP